MSNLKDDLLRLDAHANVHHKLQWLAIRNELHNYNHVSDIFYDIGMHTCSVGKFPSCMYICI